MSRRGRVPDGVRSFFRVMRESSKGVRKQCSRGMGDVAVFMAYPPVHRIAARWRFGTKPTGRMWAARGDRDR